MSSGNGAGAFIGMFILVAFLLGLLASVIAFAMMGVSILFGFIAFAWTFVCLLAWNRRFRRGKIHVESDAARAFVIRGVFGAMTVPGFLLFADIVLDVRVKWDLLAWYVVGGYTLLSVGFEYLFAARANVPYVDHWGFHPPQLPARPLPPQKETYYLPPASEPRFASLDDDELTTAQDDDGGQNYRIQQRRPGR